MNEPGGKQLRAVGKALLYRALNPTSLCHILEGGLIPAVQYGAVGIREASLLAEWRRRGRGPPVLLTNHTGCGIQHSACISLARTWSHGSVAIRSLGNTVLVLGNSMLR